MESSIRTLLKIGHDLEQQGCYLQAARSFEAACLCSEALSTSRATASLAYANLLLDHFNNLDKAKNNVLLAVRRMKNISNA